jgi:hypothetical protein
MDRPRFKYCPTGHPSAIKRVSPTNLYQLFDEISLRSHPSASRTNGHPYRPGMRAGYQVVAIAEEERYVHRITEPGGTRNNRIQNRLDVTRRTGDDLKHLRGRGLLLSRLL